MAVFVGGIIMCAVLGVRGFMDNSALLVGGGLGFYGVFFFMKSLFVQPINNDLNLTFF